MYIYRIFWGGEFLTELKCKNPLHEKEGLTLDISRNEFRFFDIIRIDHVGSAKTDNWREQESDLTQVHVALKK